jgi:hypothetical protein
MRSWFLLACILLITISGSAQERDDPYSVQSVKILLQSPKDFSTGFSEKQVNRLGDRVSVALLKIFDSNEMTKTENIRTFLPLIRSSFSYPDLIAIPEDRTPKVTLFLLGCLEDKVEDGTLKAELLQLITFVKAKTTKGK